MRRRLQWFTSSCPLRQRQHGALFLPVRTPIPPAPRQDSQDRTTHHRSRYIAASRPDYTCLTLETYITYRPSTQNAYARNTHLNHFIRLDHERLSRASMHHFGAAAARRVGVVRGIFGLVVHADVLDTWSLLLGVGSSAKGSFPLLVVRWDR